MKRFFVCTGCDSRCMRSGKILTCPIDSNNEVEFEEVIL